MEKKYDNGEITIKWQPEKCIHAGVCVRTLPKVYNPKAKPWIKIENASTEELKSQISQCPSGALSFEVNNRDNTETDVNETKVEVFKNGPLLVHGLVRVVNTNGKEEMKNKTTAFCRCGHSNNKPYCDGQHKKAQFED